MKELSGGMAPAFTDPNASFAKGSGPGDQFIASKGYRAIADPGTRPQSWSTGAVEVSSFGMKAGTLLEGGQGAGLIPVPQVVPGVVEKLFEPLGVQDVFAQGIATTSSLRYVVEGTATNSAAGVAEGGTKPASDLALSTVDEPVKKIATVLTISDELLEDSDSVSSYLNSRLGLFVRLEEERQLLRGAGTNELVGIFGRSGINTYTKLGTDDNATALAESDRQHPRVVLPTARHGDHPPEQLAEHEAPPGRLGRHDRQLLRRGPVRSGLRRPGPDRAVRRVDLEHPRGAQHRRRRGDRARRVVRPGGADLPPGRTDHRAHELARELLPNQPGDGPCRVQARLGLLPAGGVHGGERPGLGHANTSAAVTSEGGRCLPPRPLPVAGVVGPAGDGAVLNDRRVRHRPVCQPQRNG